MRTCAVRSHSSRSYLTCCRKRLKGGLSRLCWGGDGDFSRAGDFPDRWHQRRPNVTCRWTGGSSWKQGALRFLAANRILGVGHHGALRWNSRKFGASENDIGKVTNKQRFTFLLTAVQRLLSFFPLHTNKLQIKSENMSKRKPLIETRTNNAVIYVPFILLSAVIMYLYHSNKSLYLSSQR